jgi:hypothetical protein
MKQTALNDLPVGRIVDLESVRIPKRSQQFVSLSQLSYSDNPGIFQERISTGDPDRIQNQTSSRRRLQCYVIDCAPALAAQPASSDTSRFE